MLSRHVCRFFSVSMVVFIIIYFFFSSRRRHTRYIGDWSSDVCSSDLEKEKLLTLNLQDLVVYPGNHVDVVAPANDELGDLLENIWRLRRHRPPDNAVEGRLHRTGRNFERLQEIGTNTDRNDDRDQNYFTIFPPVRLPRHRRALMQFCVQFFGSAFDLLTIALAQCGMQPADIRANQIIRFRVQNIAFVAQIFLGMTQQQFAVFNVARREHELNDEAPMSNDETITKLEWFRISHFGFHWSFGFRHFKARLLRFEHLNESFLRNVDLADALHSFFSFFLFLQQFAFPGDVAAVAFRGHVFSHGRNALARNNSPTDRCLDRHLIKLPWNHYLQLRRQLTSPARHAVFVHNRRERVDRLTIYQQIELHQFRRAITRVLIIHRTITAGG